MHDTGYTLTADQAAEIMGVHPATLKRWARAGKVPAAKTPGGIYRFRQSDLDAALVPVAAASPEGAAS